MSEVASSLTRNALIGVAVLSVAGVAVTNFSPRWGLHYWAAMAALMALLGIVMSAARRRKDGSDTSRNLFDQTLHWCATLVSFAVLYRFQLQGRVTDDGAGLVGLLIIALSTLLAGLRFDWRLGVLGLALFAAALAGAFFEQFFWFFAGPAVVAMGVLLAWQLRSRDSAGGLAASATDPGRDKGETPAAGHDSR